MLHDSTGQRLGSIPDNSEALLSSVIQIPVERKQATASASIAMTTYDNSDFIAPMPAIVRNGFRLMETLGRFSYGTWKSYKRASAAQKAYRRNGRDNLEEDEKDD